MNYLDILLAKQLGGGGEPSVTVEELDVTENGTYTADENKAYSPVKVNVPNSYTASDEGKVVSSGALVSQTSQTIDTNGTYDTTLKNEVVVNVSGGSNPIAKENDVIFIDYDGEIRYSYTATQFAQLTEMPANPTHEGLTAQGWNWTLADAKAYVADNGMLTIGQLYVTDDGKTRVYITIPSDAPPSRRDFQMYIYCSSPSEVVLDWGDGTQENLTAGNNNICTHMYSTGGNYLITLNALSGEFRFSSATASTSYCAWGNTANQYNYRRNYVRALEVGTGCIAFDGGGTARSLEYITVSTQLTTLRGLGAYNNLKAINYSYYHYSNSAWQNSYFKYFSMPPNQYFTVAQYSFSGNSSLIRYEIPRMNSKQIAQYAFKDCYGLQSVVIPSGTTKILASAFANCYSLTKVVIPDTVTEIGASAFSSNYSLGEVHVKATTPPTLGSTSIFTNTPSDFVIYVPASAVEDYQTAWSTYASKIQAEPS